MDWDDQTLTLTSPLLPPLQDRDLSDSLEPAMDAMALGGVVRQAVRLLRGVDISVEVRGRAT